jgi:hypothetical protein
MDPDPIETKANHTLAVLAAITDLIHQSSLEPHSKSDREVNMVGQGEKLPEKTVKEIRQEADEKIAQAT